MPCSFAVGESANHIGPGRELFLGPNPRAATFALHSFLDLAKTDRMLLRPEIALAGHERPADVAKCPKSVPKCPRKRVFAGTLGDDHEVESAKLGISQKICAAIGWPQRRRGVPHLP